jgi:hypothetical protein
MARKKGKSVSFDAMVKFFIQHYNIPTRKDLDRLAQRLDLLEQLIRAQEGPARRGQRAKGPRKASATTAMDTVLAIIQRAHEGATVVEIKAKTGFDDKKIRNIIFRLTKLGRIVRKARGVYTAV